MINLIMNARPELQFTGIVMIVLVALLAWAYRKEIFESIRYN